MAVSEATYRQLSLEDGDEVWELVCGQLRRKPLMSQAHRDVATLLSFGLLQQLDLDRFTLGGNHSRLRIPGGTWFVPDLVVLPLDLATANLADPNALDEYTSPMPLVVEVWSKSTGDYDVSTKLGGYQERGDHEIWLVHPYERWVRAWRRQKDGTHAESLHSEGALELHAIPGVRVELQTLFRQR